MFVHLQKKLENNFNVMFKMSKIFFGISWRSWAQISVLQNRITTRMQLRITIFFKQLFLKNSNKQDQIKNNDQLAIISFQVNCKSCYQNYNRECCLDSAKDWSSRDSRFCLSFHSFLFWIKVKFQPPIFYYFMETFFGYVASEHVSRF